MKKFFALLCTGLLLALIGCGGGGGGGGGAQPLVPPVGPPPEKPPVEKPPLPTISPAGIWNGTGLNGRELVALVLDTGEYFGVYTATGNPSVTAGLLQGNGTSSGGEFTALNDLDFNFEGAGATPGTLAATVEFQASLYGTVTTDADPSSPGDFTSLFNPRYNEAPSLQNIAGSYEGQMDSETGVELFEVVISSAGQITATGRVKEAGFWQQTGCYATGSIKPHATGNVYDVDLLFGHLSNCVLPIQAGSGAGYYDPDRNLLVLALVDSGRNSGVVFSIERHVVAEIDTDGDSVVDRDDTDDDNDAVLDVEDTCPLGGTNLTGSGCTGALITGSNVVAVEGRVWAQPDLFAYLSWNDINAVCPDGVCANGGVLNGHDMTSWTWAGVDEVNSLFNFYSDRSFTLGPGPDSSQQRFSDWAPLFFRSGWRDSGAISVYHSTSGWLRAVGLAGDGVSPTSYEAYLWDCLRGDCGADAGISYDDPTDKVGTSLCSHCGIDYKHWGGGWFFRSP